GRKQADFLRDLSRYSFLRLISIGPIFSVLSRVNSFLIERFNETTGFDLSQKTVVRKGFGIAYLRFGVFFLEVAQDRFNTALRGVGNLLVVFRNQKLDRTVEVALLLGADAKLFLHNVHAFS